MADADRVQANVAGKWDDILTEEVKSLVASLQDEFADRIAGLREARLDMIDAATQRGIQPGHLPSSDATTTEWTVPDMPDELWNPGIEISGPAHMTSMFINALNPGPDGERAEGDLDDDEDSASHILSDTLLAARNRKGAVDRSLSFYNEARDRHYSIDEGEIPFFMHRERGLHLDDPDLLVDGKPASATVLGSLLTLYHAGQTQTERGQGVYFYLPKTESPEEAALYPRSLRIHPKPSPRTQRRHHSRHPPRRIPPSGLDNGRKSPRFRPLRSRTQRRPMGPQSLTPRVRHGRSRIPLARPLRRRSTNYSLHRQHLPTSRCRLPETQRCTHRRHGHRPPPPRPGSQRRSRRHGARRQDMGGRARFPQRLGSPHLPHEAGRRSLQRTPSNMAGNLRLIWLTPTTTLSTSKPLKAQ